jgi:RHS repeat-associated protein
MVYDVDGYAQVLDELVSGAVTKTYTYGLQRISENQLVGSTWTPSFYGYDGHGNVRFLTSTTGVPGDTYQYDAFGMPIASAGTTANTYLYSGERFDQNIGLYHLRARYYNQGTGRFETADPLAGSVFDPGKLQKYAYALSNPVNSSDPTGLDAVEYGITLSEDETKIAAKTAETGVCEQLYLEDMASCEKTFLSPDNPDTVGFELCTLKALINLDRCLEFTPGGPTR